MENNYWYTGLKFPPQRCCQTTFEKLCCVVCKPICIKFPDSMFKIRPWKETWPKRYFPSHICLIKSKVSSLSCWYTQKIGVDQLWSITEVNYTDSHQAPANPWANKSALSRAPVSKARNFIHSRGRLEGRHSVSGHWNVCEKSRQNR